MNFLCPACKTPLPVATPVVVACTQCGVEVDLTRVDTAPGQARLWPEVDLTGETLGAFKLTKRAGSGGMGTVYVAEGATGRCAVKVLSAQMAADPGLRERFKREAQALRAVQHPGVVHIIDEGSQNGFCWYAMEHVEGKDLRARIAEGPLPVPEVEALARQLLDALAAVHGAQLVHRDLKPGNILLATNGARLCDFGIARFDGATTLTESAALLGSLRYMAPEQRAGVTTPKSDLYSLGLVLHEAATGGLPGERDAPGGRLGRLIETLLQPNPQKRPATATAAARMIAPRSFKRTGTAVLVASSVAGVGAFATWAMLATQFTPRTTAKDRPLPAKPVAKAVVIDAGPVVAKVPRVIADIPEYEGFSLDELKKIVREHQADIVDCYEKGLEGNAALAGQIAVRVEFPSPLGVKGRASALLRPMVLGAGPKGKPAPPSKAPELPVSSSVPALQSSTLANAEVESCFVNAVQGWRFPRPVRNLKAPPRVLLTWKLDTATQEEIVAGLREEADARAKAGLVDPRDLLGTSKAPPAKTVKVLRGKNEPVDINHVEAAKKSLAEIDAAVASGKLTERSSVKPKLIALEEHINAPDIDADSRTVLQDMRDQILASVAKPEAKPVEADTAPPVKSPPTKKPSKTKGKVAPEPTPLEPSTAEK